MNEEMREELKKLGEDFDAKLEAASERASVRSGGIVPPNQSDETGTQGSPHSAEQGYADFGCDDQDWTELKLSLNQAIWEKAPGHLSLADAETAACAALSHVFECHERHTRRSIEP